MFNWGLSRLTVGLVQNVAIAIIERNKKEELLKGRDRGMLGKG
jgi:hypothetical protein